MQVHKLNWGHKRETRVSAASASSPTVISFSLHPKLKQPGPARRLRYSRYINQYSNNTWPVVDWYDWWSIGYISIGQVSSKHKPIHEPVVLAFTTYSTADSSEQEEIAKFLLCTFISSHPRSLTLTNPWAFAQQRLQIPPPKNNISPQKKLPLGQQLVQIKAHVTMHSIPRHFQISITFSYCFIKNPFFIEWLRNIKGWKSQIPCHAHVCPKGQSSGPITGMDAERCIYL